MLVSEINCPYSFLQETTAGCHIGFFPESLKCEYVQQAHTCVGAPTRV